MSARTSRDSGKQKLEPEAVAPLHTKPPPNQSTRCEACQLLPSTQSVSCRTASTVDLSPLAAHHRSQSTHRHLITISFFTFQRHTNVKQACIFKTRTRTTRLTLHDIAFPPRLRILFSLLPCRAAWQTKGLHLACILDPQRFSWGASAR